MAAETKAEALGMLARARSKLKTIRENSEQTIQTVVGTVEASGTAFALEFARGRSGKYDEESGHLELLVGGVPVSLLVGIGGHVLGFMGVGGKSSYHLHNVATGGLAAYAAEQGLRMGQKSSNEADKTAGKTERHSKILGGSPRMMGGYGYTSPYASAMANPAYAR